MRARLFKGEPESGSGMPSDVVAPNISESPDLAKQNAIQMLKSTEQKVIGAILQKNELFDVANTIINEATFTSKSARIAFVAISQIIEGRIEGVAVASTITVASQPTVLPVVSHSELEKWLDESVSSNEQLFVSLAHVMREAATERGIHVTLAKADAVAAEDLSAEEKANKIAALLASTSEIKELPMISMGKAAVNAVAQMMDAAESGESLFGIDTGFSELNFLLNGYQGAKLIVLASRPSVGKSALAIATGLGAAKSGANVVMASLEMYATELSKRGLSKLSGVDAQSIRSGALDEAEWSALVTAAEELTRIPFEIVDLPILSFAALAGLARRLRRAGKLDLLIIDYLQIMDTSGSAAKGREGQISEISRNLKTLSMALNIPIIVLSQLNRDIENRIGGLPKLSDLRESGAIEQDADIIMFVHRDVDDQSIEQTAELILAKQRDGPIGTIPIRFCKRTASYSDF